MLLVALYQIKHHNVDRVAIVTCNDLLLIQLKKDILDLMPTKYIGKVLMFDSSAVSQGITPCGAMLIDEYDKTLEKLVYVTRLGTDIKLCGLNVIKKVARVIVFSATDNNAWAPVLDLIRIP